MNLTLLTLVAVTLLAATTAQFFELDEQKRIVRQFTDHARFTSINKVQVLDVVGDPAKDEVWR